MVVVRSGETITEEENEKGNKDENTVRITPTSEITELEAGLSTVRYEGDYGFDTFYYFLFYVSGFILTR